MNTKLHLSASALVTAILCAPAFASAADSPAPSADTTSSEASSSHATTNPFSMALLAGHGFKDAFKTGFGGRLGYTFPNKIYIGASFLYHVGTQEGPVRANVTYGGAEGGYDFAAGPALLRAYAGAGAINVDAIVTMPAVGDFPGARISANETRFGVWPGVSLLLPFENGSAFVGIDAKYVIVENASALNTYGTFGLAL